MRRTTHVGLGLTATLLVCLLSAGCDTGPGLAPVEGTVTLDGTPLAGAEVEFQPTAPDTRPSVGVTDASGHYELRYTMNEKGALLGEHIVRIRMGEDADPDDVGGGAAPKTDEAADDEESGQRIPARYNVDSELKETVKSGSNTIDFALESGE